MLNSHSTFMSVLVFSLSFSPLSEADVSNLDKNLGNRLSMFSSDKFLMKYMHVFLKKEYCDLCCKKNIVISQGLTKFIISMEH